jgi:hypothetical protein
MPCDRLPRAFIGSYPKILSIRAPKAIAAVIARRGINKICPKANHHREKPVAKFWRRVIFLSFKFRASCIIGLNAQQIQVLIYSLSVRTLKFRIYLFLEDAVWYPKALTYGA